MKFFAYFRMSQEIEGFLQCKGGAPGLVSHVSGLLKME